MMNARPAQCEFCGEPAVTSLGDHGERMVCDRHARHAPSKAELREQGITTQGRTL
jgi:hypothetical protein